MKELKQTLRYGQDYFTPEELRERAERKLSFERYQRACMRFKTYRGDVEG